jgi:hypothetical protein
MVLHSAELNHIICEPSELQRVLDLDESDVVALIDKWANTAENGDILYTSDVQNCCVICITGRKTAPDITAIRERRITTRQLFKKESVVIGRSLDSAADKQKKRNTETPQ